MVDMRGFLDCFFGKLRHEKNQNNFLYIIFSGQNGEYSYSFSENESNGFIELLNQVKLGNAVDERDALSNGAVAYYKLYYTDGETLMISPGRYFKIGDTYYEFRNYDELWDKFIEFNSIH